MYRDPLALPVLTHSFPTRRSSDLPAGQLEQAVGEHPAIEVEDRPAALGGRHELVGRHEGAVGLAPAHERLGPVQGAIDVEHGLVVQLELVAGDRGRSEEHTSEIQSLMRISYGVFCLKKQKKNKQKRSNTNINKDQRCINTNLGNLNMTHDL